MPQSSDWPLRARALGALAVLVVGIALLLGAIAAVAAATAAVLGVSVPIGAAAATAAVLAVALLLVAVQVRYGYRSALAAVDARPVESGHDLHERVARIATAANVPMPTVAVANADEPNSFTVGNGSEATVVVTTGLVERLDDRQLDAVLAHEVAHLANRDATVATALAAVGEASRRLLARERQVADWLYLVGFLAAFSVLLVWLVAPLLVPLLFAYLLVSAFARALLAVTAASASLYAQSREFAADRTAAALIGDPEGLAGALEALDGDLPDRDARLQAGAALGIVPRSIVDRTPEDEEYESPIEQYFPELTGPDPIAERAEERDPLKIVEWSDVRRVTQDLRPDDENARTNRLIARTSGAARHTKRGFDRILRRIARVYARIIRPVVEVGRRLRRLADRTWTRIRRLPRSLEWRPPMHPPTADRIDRLRRIDP